MMHQEFPAPLLPHMKPETSWERPSSYAAPHGGVLEHPLPHGLQFAALGGLGGALSGPEHSVSESHGFSSDVAAAGAPSTTLHPQFSPVAATATPEGDGEGSADLRADLLAPQPPPAPLPLPLVGGQPSELHLQLSHNLKTERGRRQRRRSHGSSESSFSSGAGLSSRSSSSSSTGSRGERKDHRRSCRSRTEQHHPHPFQHQGPQLLAGPISFPGMMGGSGGGGGGGGGLGPESHHVMGTPTGGLSPGAGPFAVPPPGFNTRGTSAPQFPPSLYGFPPPGLMSSHQQVPLSGPLGQFGGMLTSVPGMGDPTGVFAAPPPAPPGMFGAGPRGTIRPGFHSGPRFMIEGSAPHLTDESLPTFPNAAAAPNRLPAHKPVRLTQPKHPLAPPGTPVYFKYGEEHYPEETVPSEYTFTETDGTICRYITNFLVYNKRGERLLPIEVLDQPRHAALVLYGSLLPATAMSQTTARRRDSETDAEGLRGKKRSASTSVTGGVSKRQMGPGREGSRRKGDGSDRWFSDRGCAITQTYPVRVELAEWCIDYGQEPTNVPFIWLISRWDVYYRLEKPAGRYISTFATAKMKFEVSTRIIKTLQHCPETSYKTLVDLLTAATRLEKSQRKAERRARLKRERRTQRLRDVKDEEEDDVLRFAEKTGSDTVTTEDSCDPKQLQDGGGVQIKKKNRNWRIQSLSTPQGTGIAVTDEAGRPLALTPWGAPYAVEGFKESMLLGLAEFLESQLRNFMEGVGGTSDSGNCPNLLNAPFMRMLRERTALRMETIQLMEAKRRALEVARSLAEAASGHGLSGGSTSMGGTNNLEAPQPHEQQTAFLQYAGVTTPGVSPNGYPSGCPHFFTNELSRGCPPGAAPYPTGPAAGMGIVGAGLVPGGMTPSGNICALEAEIQQLQQLLKDSDNDDDDDDGDDPKSATEDDGDYEEDDSVGRSRGSYSDTEEASSTAGRRSRHQSLSHMPYSNSTAVYRHNGEATLQSEQDFQEPPHSPFDESQQDLDELSQPLTNGSPVRWRRRREIFGAPRAVLDFSADSVEDCTDAHGRWGRMSAETRPPVAPWDGVAKNAGSHPVRQEGSSHVTNISPSSSSSSSTLIPTSANVNNSISGVPVFPGGYPPPRSACGAPLDVALQSHYLRPAQDRVRLDFQGERLASSEFSQDMRYPMLPGIGPWDMTYFFVPPPHPMNMGQHQHPQSQQQVYQQQRHQQQFRHGGGPTAVRRPRVPEHQQQQQLQSPMNSSQPHVSLFQHDQPNRLGLASSHPECSSSSSPAKVPKSSVATVDAHSPAKRRKVSPAPPPSDTTHQMGTSTTTTAGVIPVKRKKSPRCSVKEPHVNVAAPPLPRDVADDLDIPVTSLKYYRNPLNINDFRPFHYPALLIVADFFERMTDWLFPPFSRHVASTVPDLSFRALETIVGLRSGVTDQANAFLAATLRAFCRRFERLRPVETSMATVLAQRFAEQVLSSSASLSQTNSNLVHACAKTLSSDRYKLAYHSWIPSAVTSKQAPQVLSSNGWINANTSYVPLEVILTQATLKIITSLAVSLEHEKTDDQMTGSPTTITTTQPVSETTESVADEDAPMLVDAVLIESVRLYARSQGKDVPENMSPFEILVDSRMTPRGLVDLGFGLVSGIHWWKDEGSIDEVTWELYLRLALWECFYAVRPDELKQRRLRAEQVTSSSKRKKKKYLRFSGAGTNGDNSPRGGCAVTTLTALPEGEVAGNSVHQRTGPVETHSSDDVPESPSRASKHSTQLDHDTEEVLGGPTALSDDEMRHGDESQCSSAVCWTWDIDETKARSWGVTSPFEIKRIKRLVETQLGVVSPWISGWLSFSPSDRIFLLHWMITLLARSPLGRDMVERRLELGHVARSYLLQREKDKTTVSSVTANEITAEAMTVPESKDSLTDSKDQGQPQQHSQAIAKPALAGITKDTLSRAFDEISRRYALRRECVGEDRFLNRYFVFEGQGQNGGGLLVVELHALIPCGQGGNSNDSNNSSFDVRANEEEATTSGIQRVLVEHELLPPGVASYNDINYSPPEQEHQNTQTLVSPPKKRGARGRPKKTRTVTNAIRDEETGKDQAPTASVASPVTAADRSSSKSGISSMADADRKVADVKSHDIAPIEAAANIEDACRLNPDAFAAEKPAGPKPSWTAKTPSSILQDVDSPSDLNNDQSEVTLAVEDQASVVDKPTATAASGSPKISSPDTDLAHRVCQPDPKQKAPPSIETTVTTTITTSIDATSAGARRSERTTKGKRQTKEFLEATDDENDLSVRRKESEVKTQQRKKIPFIHATFLGQPRRSCDGALFVRRPLDGNVYFSTMCLDYPLENCIAFGPPVEREESVLQKKSEETYERICYYEGSFRPLDWQIPPLKKKRLPVKSEGDDDSSSRVANGSCLPDGGTLLSKRPTALSSGVAAGQSESSAIGTSLCTPVLHWTYLDDEDAIQRLVTNLSGSTTRERQLKYRLTKLLERGVTTRTTSGLSLPVPHSETFCGDKERTSKSNAVVAQACDTQQVECGVTGSEKSSPIVNSLFPAGSSRLQHAYNRLVACLDRLCDFKHYVLDLCVSTYRVPEWPNVEGTLQQIQDVLGSQETLLLCHPDRALTSMCVLLRAAIYLQLTLVKSTRSVPYVTKLPTIIPTSGWNFRSSPAQWDAEVKALDWILSRLVSQATAVPTSSSWPFCDNVLAHVFPSYSSRTDDGASSVSVTTSTSPDKGFPIVVEVVSDLIALVGLYFTLWTRFSVNRSSVEHLISTSASPPLLTSATEDVTDAAATVDLLPQLQEAMGPDFKGDIASLLPRCGRRYRFLRQEYVQQVQALKARGVPAVDDWLPSGIVDCGGGDDSAHYVVLIKRVWYHYWPLPTTMASGGTASAGAAVPPARDTDKIKSSAAKKKDKAATTGAAPATLTGGGFPSSTVVFSEAFDPYVRLQVSSGEDAAGSPLTFFLYVALRRLDACLTPLASTPSPTRTTTATTEER